MWILVVLIAFSLGPLTGQEPGRGGAEPPVVLCDDCGNRGAVDCKRHRRFLERERAVVCCSEAADCPKCAGVLTLDCKVCTNPAVESSARARREMVQAWREERRARFDPLAPKAGEIVHVRTRHADLSCTLEPARVGRRKVSTHELAHLYAERLEGLRAKFCEVFGVDPVRGFPREGGAIEASPRMHVHLFERQDDYQKAVPELTRMGGVNAIGIKEMGLRLVYAVWREPRSLRDDAALHRAVLHNATHLLLSNAFPIEWIGNKGHGWLDEGVAHWFEDALGDGCSTFCYEEVARRPGENYERGRWRVAVRKLVEAGSLVPFVEVYTKNSDQLSLQEHAQVFAYVDWLLSLPDGGRKLMKLVAAVKDGAAGHAALVGAFGFGPLSFDADFAEWVRATYPLRERR